ncbi:MAG: DUF2911 domain-containing protein [Bacteroidota bacterium]
MKKLMFATLALLLSMSTFAQINVPSASPSSEVTQSIGLMEATVNYARPSKKGRTIFAADGLVPYGKIWRTGANAATKLTLSADAMIGGEKVSAGEYAILTMPTAESWTFMLYPYESSSWSSYREKDPAMKLMANVKATAATVETFTIAFNNLTNTSASLDFMWDNTMVSLPVGQEIHEQVMADIKRTMAGPSAGDYNAAAGYLLDQGEDLETALMYSEKATAGDSPRFWMVRRKALILAELGRKDEAIAAAKQSMSLAKEAGNADYVALNQKSIAEWTK